MVGEPGMWSNEWHPGRGKKNGGRFLDCRHVMTILQIYEVACGLELGKVVEPCRTCISKICR